MKHTKKFLSLLLALILSFSLTACGSDLESAVETAGEIIEVVDQVAQVVESLEETEETQTHQTESEPIIEETDVSFEPEQVTDSVEEPAVPAIDEDGWYYSKDDVALFIHTYGRLPDNYITKNEARELGWEGGSVERYLEGAAIGGDRFGNYEGLLPDGHNYTECDIDTNGQSSRGAKRIIFSDDGLIYYTDDHYESFELLYGEE